MPLERTDSYLADSLTLFRQYQSLAERALAQVSDEALFHIPDPESNSLAMIVQHIAGNQRSRWTDFLTSDGEKPWRDRDAEFTPATQSRAELLASWDAGWQVLYAALESLQDSDLTRTITIRGEAHSVMQAINRQMAHYSYHIGQIVYLARLLAHENWRCLTVPRQGSAAFNEKVRAGELSQR